MIGPAGSAGAVGARLRAELDRCARYRREVALATWRCPDDPASAYYNRVLDAATVTPDWGSAEEMLRGDTAMHRCVLLDTGATSAVCLPNCFAPNVNCLPAQRCCPPVHPIPAN